jgi:hypothetical protein
MARARERLKSIEVPRLAKQAGMHCDGGGLYLRVVPPNECSWVFRYMLAGKAHTMGLGSFPDITLADARAKALEARCLKFEGKDPIRTKRAAREAAALEAAKAVTFRQCATRYIAAHRGWLEKQETRRTMVCDVQ